MNDDIYINFATGISPKIVRVRVYKEDFLAPTLGGIIRTMKMPLWFWEEAHQKTTLRSLGTETVDIYGSELPRSRDAVFAETDKWDSSMRPCHKESNLDD